MYSQLTVDSDECAVFFKDGAVIGVLPTGRHTLQRQNIPFLNAIVNNFTGGQVFISELYFVKTTPVRSVPFGGPVGMLKDPQLLALVQPRIFGEMSVVVTDPVKFVVGYVGQAAAGDNDQILSWIKGVFMNGVKQTIGEYCIRQHVTFIELAAYTQDLANAFLQHAPNLADIGVRILQMGTFSINFSDEDQKKLDAANETFASAQREAQVEQIRVSTAAAKAQQKQFELDQKFNQDARYVQQLAGNYQNYAAGQAMMGAGQGMAEHGVGGGVAGLGAQMAVGVGVGGAMAGAFNQQPQFGQPPQFTPTAGAMVSCPKCGTKQPGGKFCAECGTTLAAQKRFCTGCGQELGASSKFCANCGTSAAAPA